MIVTTTDQIKESIGINKNMSWLSFLPHVKLVEETIAIDILGQALYDIIEANSSLNAYQTKVRGYMETIISAHALYLAAPQLNLMMSDIGFTEHRSTDGSASSVSLWRFNDVRASMFFTADTYKDLCYKYLQDNAGEFTEWVASSSYTIYNSLLVRNNADLHAVIGKGERIGTFITLVPFLKLAQQKYIVPAMCTAFFSDLLTKQTENESLSAYEAQALEYAKGAMAWLALAEALPSIRVLIINGTLVTSMPAESSKVVQPISGIEKNDIINDATQKGEMYLGLLKKYLFDNADEIELYKTSPCYTQMLKQKGNNFRIKKGRHSMGFQ